MRKHGDDVMITIVLRFMVPVEKKRRFGTSVSIRIQKRSRRSTWIKMSHIGTKSLCFERHFFSNKTLVKKF